VEAQSLYRILQKMLDNGLLAAEPASERGRQYRITPEGEHRLQRATADFRRD
jgi:DNA-binding PadR family transcriptional regulator